MSIAKGLVSHFCIVHRSGECKVKQIYRPWEWLAGKGCYLIELFSCGDRPLRETGQSTPCCLLRPQQISQWLETVHKYWTTPLHILPFQSPCLYLIHWLQNAVTATGRNVSSEQKAQLCGTSSSCCDTGCAQYKERLVDVKPLLSVGLGIMTTFF